MLPSGKFSRIALVLACLLAGSLILFAERADHSGTSRLLSDLLQTALVVWTGICATRTSLRSSGYLRRLWLLLGTSVFFAAIAQILKIYFKYVVQLPFASPWPSDILYILWAIPALMMLLPQREKQHQGVDWEAALDFVQLGIVALTAYLYFFYLTSRWQAEGQEMVRNVFRAQMYRDFAIVAAFLLASRFRKSPLVKALFNRTALFFLLEAGWLLLYLFRWPAANRATWSDLAWCAPYLFLTAYAVAGKAGDSATKQEAVSPARGPIISRVLPVCIPLLVLLMAWQTAQERVTLAWAAIAASFLVSICRLILTNEGQLRISESLRQAEAALQQSAEMFATAFRSSPDAISISLLPEARFLTVNESFLRMTGYSQEEVLGKSSADLGIWVDREQRFKYFARIQAGEEIKEEEFLMRRKTGGIRTVQFSAARVQLEGGLGVLAIMRDVTDHRLAEEAIRVSEEHFRTLIQDLHVGIVLLGPHAETLFANRAALRIFGFRGDQVLGNASSQFEMTSLREDGTEMPFPERSGPRAIATRLPVRGDVVGWRREGSNEVLWTLVDAVPHFTEQGEVANVILSISNITQRKKAEQELRASEERFRTLLENLHIAVILLGPNAEILFANRAAEEILGIPIESILGKTSDELGWTTLREDGTEIPFALRPGPRAMATGKPVRNEVIGWRRPGSQQVLWVLGEVVPLHNKEGKLERTVAAFSDITKRKEAEEALHQLSARLLRLQDEERRRLGRELHDSLAQSVMAVSLDLAQVARSSPLGNKRAKQSLSEARRVLREMSREIRTLSYLLHPPVLDELGLASAVKEYAQGFSERSGIALELDVQSDFARIPQETETALFRIVQESLANIQKHSGSSTAKIRLHANHEGVELEISDRGCGIASQSENENAGAPKASRLGVGILGMRERTAQLGGALVVQSNASGTTVRATIPITCEASHAAPSHSRGG